MSPHGISTRWRDDAVALRQILYGPDYRLQLRHVKIRCSLPASPGQLFFAADNRRQQRLSRYDIDGGYQYFQAA